MSSTMSLTFRDLRSGLDMNHSKVTTSGDETAPSFSTQEKCSVMPGILGETSRPTGPGIPLYWCRIEAADSAKVHSDPELVKDDAGNIQLITETLEKGPEGSEGLQTPTDRCAICQGHYGQGRVETGDVNIETDDFLTSLFENMLEISDISADEYSDESFQGAMLGESGPYGSPHVSSGCHGDQACELCSNVSTSFIGQTEGYVTNQGPAYGEKTYPVSMDTYCVFCKMPLETDAGPGQEGGTNKVPQDLSNIDVEHVGDQACPSERQVTAECTSRIVAPDGGVNGNDMADKMGDLQSRPPSVESGRVGSDTSVGNDPKNNGTQGSTSMRNARCVTDSATAGSEQLTLNNDDATEMHWGDNLPKVPEVPSQGRESCKNPEVVVGSRSALPSGDMGGSPSTITQDKTTVREGDLEGKVNDACKVNLRGEQREESSGCRRNSIIQGMTSMVQIFVNQAAQTVKNATLNAKYASLKRLRKNKVSHGVPEDMFGPGRAASSQFTKEAQQIDKVPRNTEGSRGKALEEATLTVWHTTRIPGWEAGGDTKATSVRHSQGCLENQGKSCENLKASGRCYSDAHVPQSSHMDAVTWPQGPGRITGTKRPVVCDDPQPVVTPETVVDPYQEEKFIKPKMVMLRAEKQFNKKKQTDQLYPDSMSEGKQNLSLNTTTRESLCVNRESRTGPVGRVRQVGAQGQISSKVRSCPDLHNIPPYSHSAGTMADAQVERVLASRARSDQPCPDTFYEPADHEVLFIFEDGEFETATCYQPDLHTCTDNNDLDMDIHIGEDVEAPNSRLILDEENYKPVTFSSKTVTETLKSGKSEPSDGQRNYVIDVCKEESCPACDGDFMVQLHVDEPAPCGTLPELYISIENDRESGGSLKGPSPDRRSMCGKGGSMCYRTSFTSLGHLLLTDTREKLDQVQEIRPRSKSLEVGQAQRQFSSNSVVNNIVDKQQRQKPAGSKDISAFHECNHPLNRPLGCNESSVALTFNHNSPDNTIISKLTGGTGGRPLPRDPEEPADRGNNQSIDPSQNKEVFVGHTTGEAVALCAHDFEWDSENKGKGPKEVRDNLEHPNTGVLDRPAGPSSPLSKPNRVIPDQYDIANPKLRGPTSSCVNPKGLDQYDIADPKLRGPTTSCVNSKGLDQYDIADLKLRGPTTSCVNSKGLDQYDIADPKLRDPTTSCVNPKDLDQYDICLGYPAWTLAGDTYSLCVYSFQRNKALMDGIITPLTGLPHLTEPSRTCDAPVSPGLKPPRSPTYRTEDMPNPAAPITAVPSDRLAHAGHVLRTVLLMRAPHMIRDRKYYLRTYRRCMVGTEMVDWLMQQSTFVHSRNQAVGMLQALLEEGVIVHVCHEHQFKDKYLFYRFHDDDQGIGIVPTHSDKKECEEDLQDIFSVLAQIGPDAMMRMILRKLPHERTMEDLETIYEELLHIKALSHLSTMVKRELASVLVFESHAKAGTVLFNQGDEGKSWYIILKGSVNVVIYGKGVVCTLHEGDDFGKLALVNDAPRAATIVLREDNCHFLRVDKEDFNRILRDVEANTVRLKEHGVDVLVLEKIPTNTQSQDGTMQSHYKYSVMAGTPEKMLEHLLETRIAKLDDTAASDTFLDDFLLTHVIFMPSNHLCPTLMAHYHALMNTANNKDSGDYALTNKRKVVQFVEEWSAIIGDAFWEDRTIAAFLEELHSSVLEDCKVTPQLREDLALLEKVMQRKYSENSSGAATPKQMVKSRSPVQRSSRRTSRCESPSEIEPYIPRRPITNTDENMFKVYWADHTYTTLKVPTDATVEQIINNASDKLCLGVGEELVLCEVKCTGERVVFKEHDLCVTPGMSINSRLFIAPREHIDALTPLPEQEGPTVSSGTLMEMMSSREMAYQLTRFDWELFSCVHEYELIYLVFGRHKFHRITANLDLFLRRFNEVQFWVVTEMCLASTVSKRVQLLRKLIKIASYCKENRNLNSFFAIVMGLSNIAVSRLSQTWEKLPNKLKKMFADFEMMMDPSRNHRAYRLAVAKMEPPIIPFMPLLMKDMTFTHEGNKTQFDGLVNFEKMHMIAQTLRTVQICRSRPIELEQPPVMKNEREIRHYIRNLKVINNQRVLTQLSHRLEARRS